MSRYARARPPAERPGPCAEARCRRPGSLAPRAKPGREKSAPLCRSGSLGRPTVHNRIQGVVGLLPGARSTHPASQLGSVSSGGVGGQGRNQIVEVRQQVGHDRTVAVRGGFPCVIYAVARPMSLRLARRPSPSKPLRSALSSEPWAPCAAGLDTETWCGSGSRWHTMEADRPAASLHVTPTRWTGPVPCAVHARAAAVYVRPGRT